MKTVICGLVVVVIVASLFLGLGCRGPAAPENVEDFYRNNTVTLIVVYGPGGGTDFAARVISTYWNEVTGGTMVVKNMAGAGGLLGMNHIYELEPDGLTLGYGESAASLLGPVLLRQPGVKFDATKFTYLANNAVARNVYGVGPESPYESWEDLQQAEGVKFGGLTIDANTASMAVLIDVFGLKNAKIVLGYGNTMEIALAADKGEIDVAWASTEFVNDFIERGLIKRVLIVDAEKRSPLLPDTPTTPELAKLTPEQEQMWKVAIAACGGGKPILAAPDLSQDKVEYLRAAFDKLFKIKSFQRQMQLKYPRAAEPDFTRTGEEFAKMVTEMLATPTDVVDKLLALTEKYAN